MPALAQQMIAILGNEHSFFYTLGLKTPKNMFSRIRFSANVDLQKAPITTSSEKCAQFPIFRL